MLLDVATKRYAPPKVSKRAGASIEQLDLEQAVVDPLDHGMLGLRRPVAGKRPLVRFNGGALVQT